MSIAPTTERRNRVKSFLIEWANSRPLLFCAVMPFVMMLTKATMTPFVDMSGGSGTTEGILDVGAVLVLISFLALPIETFLGQTFPIWLLRRLGVQRWRWLIIGSSLVFGALHLSVDVGSFFVGFGGGVTLSLCWLAWREVSFLKAFIGVTVIHAVHNAIAMAVFLLFFA